MNHFNIQYFAAIYALAGRDTVRRMLIVPGGILNGPYVTMLSHVAGYLPRPMLIRALTIPEAPLLAKQKQNQDEPAEIIAKRDAAANAVADLITSHTNSMQEQREVAADAVLDLIEEYANLDTD